MHAYEVKEQGNKLKAALSEDKEIEFSEALVALGIGAVTDLNRIAMALETIANNIEDLAAKHGLNAGR